MTEVTRSVINSITGNTENITDDDGKTFREACSSIAPFDIEWVVQDQDGNDISEKTLKEYTGKAQISPADVAGGVFF